MHIHSGHLPLHSVFYNGKEYIIESDVYGEEEKNEILKMIDASKVEDNIERIECKHYRSNESYKDINSGDNDKLITLENRDTKKDSNIGHDLLICGDDACKINENLYLCLTCKYIGCGRLQYGKEGNEHAKKHFESTNHCRVLQLESLGLDGNNRTYCYLCDSFVYNKNVREEMNEIGIDYIKIKKEIEANKKMEVKNSGEDCNKKSSCSNKNVSSKESINNNKNESINKSESINNNKNESRNVSDSLGKKYRYNDDVNVIFDDSDKIVTRNVEYLSQYSAYNKTKFVGIKNLGNTCFISASMHFLSLITFDNLESHFYSCQNEPLTCFLCQFVKVIFTLQNKFNKHMIDEDIDTIDILDFIVCLEAINPLYNRFLQQDVNEFLIFLFLHIKEHEILGLFPDFTSKFEIKMGTVTKCKDCNESQNYQDELEMTVPCCDTVQEGINEYFLPLVFECGECKNEKIKNTYVLHAPEFLIITLQIFKYENGNAEKIIKKGVSDEEITINVKNVNNNASDLTENVKYKLLSSIIHKGKNTVVGHYMFKYRNVIVNDDKIVSIDEYDDKEEDLQEYLLLYKRCDASKEM
ncbi:hypothetical protein BDAP_001938 [Binucleata daphniae]